MLRRMKKRFLDWPLAQKFVFVFSLMTLLSGVLMVGALHLGLSVFEEKFYEKSLQELDFFLQRVDGDIQEVDTLTRSIAVDSAVQQQLGELAVADPETAAYYYLLTGVRLLLLEKLYQSRQPFVLRFSEQGRKFISRFRLGVNAGDVGHPFRLHLMQEINQGFNLSQKGSRIPPNGRAPFPEGGTDNDGLPEFLAAQQGQVGFINQVVKVPF